MIRLNNSKKMLAYTLLDVMRASTSQPTKSKHIQSQPMLKQGFTLSCFNLDRNAINQLWSNLYSRLIQLVQDRFDLNPVHINWTTAKIRSDWIDTICELPFLIPRTIFAFITRIFTKDQRHFLFQTTKLNWVTY